MENAQPISLSGRIALQRQMDVVANDMANINITGSKSENIVFDDDVALRLRPTVDTDIVTVTDRSNNRGKLSETAIFSAGSPAPSPGSEHPK